MNGILIYPKEEISRNAFAIEQYQKNLDVSLVLPDYRGSADFVINRTNNADIGEYFESQGIRVFNKSAFSLLANDKYRCYRFMEQNGVPILPIDYNDMPVVIKPRNGKGGEGVALIHSGSIKRDDSLVYQKPASDLGKDLRVFVIGGKIIASVLRTSTTDFRSNYCLGGGIEIYHLSESELKLVKKIISLVQGDYYGIDFVFNNGKIVFNELEDSVGARMVYDLTDIDIIRQYCNYINNMI